MIKIDKERTTLNDTIYFAACEGFSNKTAYTFAKMFGYTGNPKGISITNLMKVPIGQHYGPYHLGKILFLPPMILNAKRMIGVATMGDSMVVTLHLYEDMNTVSNIQFFREGMKYLEELCSQ